jgi:hypothetical protein
MTFFHKKLGEAREGLGSMHRQMIINDNKTPHITPLSTTIYHTLAYFAYATIVGSRFLLALAVGFAY